MDRALEGLERDERALEKIADALNRLANVAQAFYAALYPEKRSVREATLTVVRTPQQADLEETIQGSESTLEQWTDLGPREKAFIEKRDAKKS